MPLRCCWQRSPMADETPTASRAKTNDRSWIPTVGSESRMAIAAPSPAPADTPRMSGETNGLRKTP